MVVAAGAAAVGTAYASNDVYANWVTASDYNGFNFGFKNTMSRRLDVEMGAGVYTDREPTGWDKPKPKWAYDLNAVYNILPRYSTINPYVGIATTTMPEFGLGGLVGVSAGFWENRVQLHARYKWIKDFDFNHRLANQFEIGISVKYKHGWNFEDQDFRYHDEDDYAPTRFGVQAGVVFASTNAEEAKARTGYNIMFNMAFDIDDTPWAINWGMIGINSRGWKTGNRQTILYYMSPAALNASYRVELGYAGLAALPFAGFQCDLLLNNKRNSIGYDRLRQFDFSPVLGAALQVNRAVEVGAQYNYGMVSIAKQSDIRHRDLQLFTRLFF
jgi:hypothetical protein